ncbi:MAG: hypothetical protein ACR2MP_30295 [Streptosporangiaceae bacterium]
MTLGEVSALLGVPVLTGTIGRRLATGGLWCPVTVGAMAGAGYGMLAWPWSSPVPLADAIA